MATESNTPAPPSLEQKLDALPRSPGCYLFLDGEGRAIYVGKAKSLRSRVRSYFQSSSSDDRYFIPILRRIACDLETIVTATEKEAAVLENELIKKHQPRFNVKLRDDKDFLSLRLDRKRRWPRLETVRRPTADGARYYGPYHSATSARRTLHLVNKHFHLRTCSDADFASRRRPCLQYQIKRCPAPCVYEVSEAEYDKQVRAVDLFLSGRHDELTGELDQEMKNAAEGMAYERAAVYRDQLRAVERIREAQRVVAVRDVDQDSIGLYREGTLVEVQLLLVRQGRLRDALSFSFRGVEIPDDEVLSAFVRDYYGAVAAADQIPDEVLCPLPIAGADGVAEWLTELRGKKAALVVPQRGPRRKLMQMAADNARHAFSEKQRASDDLEARLAEIQRKLRLTSLPRRIECCDISHLGGGDTVGAVVSLLDGKPDKKRYRSFHVKSVADGDDYGAMHEVLSRRFRRGAKTADADGGDSDWDLPDLVVVDGGRGQLAVALSAARDLGLHDLAIVGLAKERENRAGDKLVDRVYLPGQKNGIALKAQSPELFFLARARDEAHRFANHARKKLGSGRRIRSALEDVKGLGPKARRALLKARGSIDAIKNASDEQLLAIEGVRRQHVTAVRAHFGPPGTVEREPEPSLAEAPEASPTPEDALSGQEAGPT